MIPITHADGRAEQKLLRQLKARSGEVDRKVTAAVTAILDNVRQNGDRAVENYTLQFDGQMPEHILVERPEMEAALDQCDSKFVYALYQAAANIRDFHERQKRQSFLNTLDNGVILGQRVRGLKRVGLYVPGGTAAYPSSVLMNAIPAKIAGVEELVMVTPPAKDGSANPDILAAAAVAGVDRIYLMGRRAGSGGAWLTAPKRCHAWIRSSGRAIFMLPRAKRLLYGTVDIDMVAGPSEILIVADDTANPAFLAADLMSQAEHDVLASAILLTTSERIARETVSALKEQVRSLSRRKIIEQSLLDYGAVIICRTLDEAIGFANDLAPEHLELCVENPMEYIGRIDNAGSVFLGNYSPEPLGDYYAGPNHVLPTSGTARFFSPLGVDSFVKKSSFLYYTEAALREAKDDIVKLAETEGLTAHANSIKVRF